MHFLGRIRIAYSHFSRSIFSTYNIQWIFLISGSSFIFLKAPFLNAQMSQGFSRKKDRRDPFLNSFSKVDIDRVFRQSGILLQGVSICFLPFCYTLKNVLLSIHGPFFAQDCVKAIMTSIEKTMTSKYEKLEVHPSLEIKLIKSKSGQRILSLYFLLQP